MDEKIVDSFWKWFAENSMHLAMDIMQNGLLEELDKWVFQLGGYSWEIGPGYNASNMFALSPSGNKDLLKETKNIIAKAPMLTGWEFYYAKQPLQADLNFILYQTDSQYLFEASTWKYILLKFSDNTYDILIKAGNIEDLSEEDQYLAANLAIVGSIGEEKRIELIGDIEIVKEFPAEYEKAGSDFGNLLKHLKQHFKSDLK